MKKESNPSTIPEGEFLAKCLDSADNTICIYDDKARLVYANKAYCDLMNIHDLQAMLGKTAAEILKYSKMKIQATKTTSSRLKMMDVIKTGKKTIDWEIRVEPEQAPSDALFIVNNLYPVKASDGTVQNLIEISSSSSFNLNETKKLMGLTAEYSFDSILGTSPAIQEAKDTARRYASSNFDILISGESGVGKELFAQAIHNHSHRKDGPFVAINCASLPDNLIESELFGYVKGAFTGADQNGQIGKFELSDGGTLFLDEIGEMPLALQAKLLRVLETRQITRIGDNTQTRVNVRVIAATNRNLLRMIAEGSFREDLYYRLQVLNLYVPPLRERVDDILLLTDYFLSSSGDHSEESEKKDIQLSDDAVRRLLHYSWPGNVRELRNVIYRISILSSDDIISGKIVETAIQNTGKNGPRGSSSTSENRIEAIQEQIQASYRDLVQEALSSTGGNKKEAARLLGVTRQTIYRMIDKYCK